MTENPPTKPKPVFDRKHIFNRQGKDTVLYAGLLNAAHTQFGLRGITTTLVLHPSGPSGIDYAIVAAIVETDYGSFSALGEAGGAREQNPVGKQHPIRMAETRAKARALRDAMNVTDIDIADDVPEYDRETGEIAGPRPGAPSPRPTPGASYGRFDSGAVPPARGTDSPPPFPGEAPGDAAPRPVSRPPATPGGVRARWLALVKECLAEGFTTDPEVSKATNAPLVPTLTEVELADATEVIKHGNALRASLNRWKDARAKAEAEAEADEMIRAEARQEPPVGDGGEGEGGGDA